MARAGFRVGWFDTRIADPDQYFIFLRLGDRDVPQADDVRLTGAVENHCTRGWPPLLTVPVLMLLSLSMDSFWATTHVESILVAIAWRLSTHLALAVKKGILALIDTGGSGVSHDVKTSQQIARQRSAA